LPLEFFNNIDFSLSFSALMDNGVFDEKPELIPNFVSKFFENQNVTSNFQDYLKTYIEYTGMKETLHTNTNTKISKRIKI